MKSTLYAAQTSLFHSYPNTANQSTISISFLKRHVNGVVLLQ